MGKTWKHSHSSKRHGLPAFLHAEAWSVIHPGPNVLGTPPVGQYSNGYTKTKKQNRKKETKYARYSQLLGYMWKVPKSSVVMPRFLTKSTPSVVWYG